MSEIDLAGFTAAHAAGAVVVDVREPEEYVRGHVPGARLIPLGRLPQHVGELPHAERIYLICAAGNRSKAAVSLLTRAGFDAVSVAGGTSAWERAGRATVTGSRPGGH
ncbi:MAG: rhodanese-like domain-containing protein [Hamadaea sp.]|uniref:rhodanese-like domain-containing protein n=1 Tax=Hamadaea sp. NPDC050747 TaxID=3155789 RepID=UPI0017B62050|nr:rhodanese-like domain-containing protein [Hamadaea sp.]NUR46700.1 rhodanese-like domain-containing protein [Hamadaea sp.]NUT03567.1 rhodanese-like domain-containing protein [Hamadaea sp.]